MPMSPYQNFRQRRKSIFIEPGSLAGRRPTVIDTDESTLYETFRFPLRTAIIEHDDTTALKKYLRNAPWASKRGHSLGMGSDPFIVAATHGSLDSLRVLLDHYAHFIEPGGKTDLDGRCCRVLNTAAHCGHLEVVKLLLDHPLLQADIHHNNNGYTPIMIAAEAPYCKNNIEKKEAVINFLIDRGARASGAEHTWYYYLDPITGVSTQKQMPIFMTLNFAAEWAGTALIRRLIENGADPHVKMMEDKEFTFRTDVTIISTASRCANVDALKVLLECASKVSDVADAACQVSMEEDPREVTAGVVGEKVQRIITVLSLLLDCSPETINTQDIYGNTPLHYAAKTYSNRGRKYTAIYQFLCELNLK